MRDQLTRILSDFERDLDNASQAASVRFNALLRATLDEWAQRFPRHSFSAWEGHGLLSIEVSPPVAGESFLDHLSPENYRGAVAEIVSDAATLINAFNESEIKTCYFVDSYKTEGTKNDA